MAKGGSWGRESFRHQALRMSIRSLCFWGAWCSGEQKLQIGQQFPQVTCLEAWFFKTLCRKKLVYVGNKHQRGNPTWVSILLTLPDSGPEGGPVSLGQACASQGAWSSRSPACLRRVSSSTSNDFMAWGLGLGLTPH